MFPEGGGFVKITVPEGGPTAAGMNPEDGTAKKSCRPPPPPPQHTQVKFWNSPYYQSDNSEDNGH